MFQSFFGRCAGMAVLLMAWTALSAPIPAWAGDPPQLEKPKGEACLRPTPWMRRNHMDFLKHKRALTVREGVRVRSESLKNCATCHPSREKFCDRCHDYVGVVPDCFDCHIYPK